MIFSTKKNDNLKPLISVELFAHIWVYDVQNGLDEKNSASHPIMFFITSRHSFEF